MLPLFVVDSRHVIVDADRRLNLFNAKGLFAEGSAKLGSTLHQHINARIQINTSGGGVEEKVGASAR